ncbi:LLM class flavin-dependent oxidoreductase [Halobiforma nitratireducens]|uniref:Luciferase-like protein n=1 Tax=Halobiforma nitratireducens JCM 10879 TaxID=1227454 RepID=M0MAF2_9EURY|nr:LLM class flavin-dependent oxidoreductase [Halobiforma nitratireducens]EMA42328.1 luciferase-like protein [Halobiforma nitratireducens JCM 10879]
MNVGLVLTAGDAEQVERGVRAEELGYDSLWLGELWGESAVVQLAELATRTDEIALGSAILNVYSRSPAVLAMTAASLERASGGRFTLGIGTSTPKAIEDLHGGSFDRPVRRAHETIEIVRRFLATDGDPVDYDGVLLSVADFPALEDSAEPTPIYHAGLGPANRRVVGRLCDGWIPHNIPFSELESAFEEVAGAARERDRDPESITVAPYVPAAVNEDRDRARRTIRRHVAYYVGSGEGYRNAVAMAYPERADRIADAWRSGDRDEAAETVSDEMVDDLGIAATPDDARQRLRSLVDGTGIDEPLIVLPEPAATETLEATMTAFAPDG